MTKCKDKERRRGRNYLELARFEPSRKSYLNSLVNDKSVGYTRGFSKVRGNMRNKAAKVYEPDDKVLRIFGPGNHYS